MIEKNPEKEKENLEKLSTTTRAPTTMVPTPTSWYSVYGTVQRDPHVVLPLKPGINLCFNWNGKDEEVSLLHDLYYDIIF